MLISNLLVVVLVALLLRVYLIHQAWQLWPEGTCCEHLSLARPLNEISPGACESGNYTHLQTKGWTVLPNFIPEELRLRLIEYYKTLPWANLQVYEPIGYKNGHDLTSRFPEMVSLLLAYMDSVRASTDINIPALDRNAFARVAFDFTYVNSSHEATDVHQDYWNEVVGGNTRDQLTFYLILEKTSVENAGLLGLPFDELRRISPATYEKIVPHGMVNWQPAEDKLGQDMLCTRSPDRNYILDFDLSAMLCAPKLRPGDLYTFRGDAVHGTQQGPPNEHWKPDWERLALKWDIVPPFTPHLLGGGIYKATHLNVQHWDDANDAILKYMSESWISSLPTLAQHAYFKTYKVLIKLVYFNRRHLFGLRFSADQAYLSPEGQLLCNCG